MCRSLVSHQRVRSRLGQHGVVTLSVSQRREAEQVLRSLLDRVASGHLYVDGPAAAALVLRLEGAVSALVAFDLPPRHAERHASDDI